MQSISNKIFDNEGSTITYYVFTQVHVFLFKKLQLYGSRETGTNNFFQILIDECD